MLIASLAEVCSVAAVLPFLGAAGAYWSRLYGAHFPQPIGIMVELTVVHTVTGALVLAVTLVTTLVSHRLIAVRSAVRDRERSGRRAYHCGRENHSDGAGSSRR